jgi:hypothetical protein
MDISVYNELAIIENICEVPEIFFRSLSWHNNHVKGKEQTLGGQANM